LLHYINNKKINKKFRKKKWKKTRNKMETQNLKETLMI
jgi:hypothetical protein